MDAVQNFRQEALASYKQLKENSTIRKSIDACPIKVALIDDGVTPKKLHVKGSVKEGWPLDVLGKDRMISTYFRSRDGHGTAMANLIHYVCPFAHLYVAKLEKSAPKPYRSVAHMAAEAVKWAASRDVDIISMSWTIKGDDSKEEDERELGTQIRLAGEKGISLFCSFNDNGEYRNITRLLPSKDNPYLRRVGSCKGDGSASGFVEKKKVDYLLPGEHLPEVAMQQSIGGDGTDKGSSASTALAAGLAAMILWCEVRVGGDKKAFSNMRMYGLFDKLRTGTTKDEGSLVDVSGLMDKAGASGETAGKVVAGFVESLRNKMAEELDQWRKGKLLQVDGR